MDLSLDQDLGQSYASLAQRARIITEAWVTENLYCLGCEEDHLGETRAGRAIVDFRCTNCRRKYQLKSQRRPFRNRVLDAAWRPMAAAVRAGKAPNFLFLHYDPIRWRVANLFGVPGHFMTLSALERREPLARTARRAGWVGCNILLGMLPRDAIVEIIRNHTVISPAEVRRRWIRFDFLSGSTHSSRGWAADILSCIRRLNQRMFTLEDIYQFEDELSKMHPRNRHVRPKIRQQLQVLRDQGVVKFLGGGHYLTVD